MEPGRPLTHRSNTVVEASRLHRARDRKERGETLIEGPHLLDEALRAGTEINRVFFAEDDPGLVAARQAGLETFTVDERGLARIAGTETPRGPIAVVAIPPESTTPRPQRLLVSWGVSDPGNVGTMIRTAAAFGWGFGYADGTADPWSPKVLRSAAGFQFTTWIGRIGSVEELRNSGHSPIATVVRGGEDLSRVEAGKVAVLVGEEASGLPRAIVELCDASLTIPMPGATESLNAGVAAGIVVYALSKSSGENDDGV